jgi:hypothetical protein
MQAAPARLLLYLSLPSAPALLFGRAGFSPAVSALGIDMASVLSSFYSLGSLSVAALAINVV